MNEEKVKKLLNELAAKTVEAAPPQLAENIKQQIPHKLVPHRSGMNTINIVIDLRVSKLAAAAVIILTTILLANFLGDSTGQSIYQDSKLLIQYWLGDTAKSNLLAVKSRYEYLVQKGKEVAYYGDNVDPKDSDAILMQWKLSDGNYRIIFGNLREETVSAEELIKLQSRMLQKRSGK